MIKPKQLTGEKEEAKVNPSYDKKQSIKVRMADFLGKYHIILNGVKAHEPFSLKNEGKPNERCDDEDKQEIIKFVELLISDTLSRHQ